MTSTTTPASSGKSASSTQDSSIPITTSTNNNLPDRHLTVGVCPEGKLRTPWIRLRGKWLLAAGFTPQTRIRVQVRRGCLFITRE
ncbi:SymE family type I addiction module toxin [Paraherbaspirillum soli]|uniref:SymE family type I addiction module toxin n=1 Tax=Paraherbaspirillum soli TaxID=631222 RepID=A0ABW0M4M7_9BURK